MTTKITKLNKKVYVGALLLVVFAFVTPQNVFAVDLPYVTTSSATYLEGTSAVLRGYVNPRGITGTKVWFEWGTEVPLTHSTVQIDHGSQYQSVLFPISGLELNTRYFFRVVAENSAGVSYGGVSSFKTNKVESAVSKGAPVAITEEATIHSNGTIVNLNGYVDTRGVRTRVWFQWGLTQDLRNTTERSLEISASGNFSETITGLTTGTLYYYRAVVSNDNGTSFGKILSVTPTKNSQATGVYGGGPVGATPIAVTWQAEDVAQNSAFLRGEAVLGDVSAPASVWFEWGKTRSLGNTTPVRNAFYGFSESLVNLSPNTTYYYKAVVKNEFGLSDGSIIGFTTASHIYDSGDTFSPNLPDDTDKNSLTGEEGEEKVDVQENGFVAGAFFGLGKLLPHSFWQWILLTLIILTTVLLGRNYKINIVRKNNSAK